jgi:hypothetical protein
LQLGLWCYLKARLGLEDPPPDASCRGCWQKGPVLHWYLLRTSTWASSQPDLSQSQIQRRTRQSHHAFELVLEVTVHHFFNILYSVWVGIT